MNQYIKTIGGIGASILCLFILLYFFGLKFVAILSPSVEVVAVDMPYSNEAIQPGKKIPSFDLVDLSGAHVRSFETNGKSLVVTFWSTWNTSSTDQIRILDDYMTHTVTQNLNFPVRIIAIDSQETSNTAANFIRRGGYDVPVVIDSTGEVSTLYGVKTLPTTFFINKDGVLVEEYIGILSEKMLVDKVEKILK